MNYLEKIQLFDVYLFTNKKKQKNEYKIPNNTKRIISNNNLFQLLNQMKIDILIYELTDVKEMEKLINLKNLKVIFYHHSSIFDWIYFSYFYFKIIYKILQHSKYVITLVPFENDYLFKKWGIRSILMNNFMTYDYKSINPSTLTSKTIIMIGRGNDKKKRFDLGIKAMKYIGKEVNNCSLNIISSLNGIRHLINLVSHLKLEKIVNFLGYSSTPETFYKNASLHFFPSISESFGLVLSETKIYGIPSILLGIDYVSIAYGGTIIIFDDNPESLAKEAIKILQNDKYRIRLGKEARKSIKKFNNELVLLKWIKLILAVYQGENYYEILRKQDKPIPEEESLKTLNIQVELLKMRLKRFKNVTTKQFENFHFLQNLK